MGIKVGHDLVLVQARLHPTQRFIGHDSHTWVVGQDPNLEDETRGIEEAPVGGGFP